jgi:hypothetical protein
MFGVSQRPLRKLTSIKAQMRVGDEWTEVGLANASTQGLLVKSSRAVEVGSEVEIRHRGVVITGLVVWATATRFGLESFNEIDLTALTARSDLQPDRRLIERAPPTTRRLLARWRFWNG